MDNNENNQLEKEQEKKQEKKGKFSNENMKPCKACNEPISKKAKQCPMCGQDQRNWFARHKILTGILVLVILLIIGSMGGSDDNGETTTTSGDSEEEVVEKSEKPTEPEITVSAGQFIEEYEANEVRADDQYKGKIIEITGIVNDVSVMMEQTFITINAGGDFDIVSAQCFFKDEAEIEKLKDLDKGDEVTVIGTVDGKSINIGINNCRLK